MSITGPRQSGKARGRRPKLFFRRDAFGKEVDIIVEKGAPPSWAIEVKSSSTYSPRFFKNLDVVCAGLGIPLEHRSVVYAGDVMRFKFNV